MSAPQRPLTGEQVLQRIGAEATGRELITAADAAAARDAIEAQKQNDGLDYLSGLSNLAEPPIISGIKTLLTADGWEALNYQTATLSDNHVWLGVSAPGAPPVEFETGAKGRDLLAIADDSALQSEIVARLVSADLIDLGRVLIGVNAPKDGEAFNITSVGTKPTSAFPDEILMGDGAAMFGAWVDAPSIRYGGTDILERENTWTAAQRFNAAIDQRAPGGEQLLHRYVGSATGEVPADSWQMRRGGALARDIYITSSDNVDIILGLGASGLSAFRHNLSIGATSIPDGSRTLIKGGSTPGTPAGDEARFGGGVGRFGSHVSAAHYRMSTYSTPASGTLNNAPIGEAGFVRCPITGSLTITGLQGGVEGRWLILFNLSTGNSVTLAHENGGSDAANQIRTQTNADVTFSGRRSVMLMYDTGISKWIPLLFGL